MIVENKNVGGGIDMLIAVEPVRYVEEIDCSDMKRFRTIQEAKEFKHIKENQSRQSNTKFMIIKEQGGGMYYVMPNYDGILIGDCYSDQ